MKPQELTRQDILVFWYNAYLEGDRELFNEAEFVLTQMDRGKYNGPEN